jgi:transposase InsO family protein
MWLACLGSCGSLLALRPPQLMPTPLRALLLACLHASLAYRDALLELWSDGDAIMKATARLLEVDHQQHALAEECRILLARIGLTPPRQRPRCSGTLKTAVLRYRERFALPVAEVARDVGRSRSTIYRWIRRRQAGAKDAASIDSPTKPTPPLRRIADSVRDLVREMDLAGFPGNGSIAGALRHLGVRISERSAGRMRREPLLPKRRARQVPTGRWLSWDDRAEEEAPTWRAHLGGIDAALCEVRSVFALSLGRSVAALRRLRQGTRDRRIDARAQERTRRAEQLAILREYLGSIEPLRRPRYTAPLRVDILAFRHRHGLSHQATARRFLIDRGTVCQWNVRADETPTPGLLDIGLRSAQQAVERAVRVIAPSLRDSLRSRMLAALLTVVQAATTRSRPGRKAPEARTSTQRPVRRRAAPIAARRPNHYWMADLTVFPQMGSPDLHLAAFIDVYSRRRLGQRLFVGQPSSEELAALLHQAGSRHGSPRHFLPDQGGQFKGDAFASALEKLGCDHREGAVGQKGSIAIIERLWRTVKQALDIHNCPTLIPDLLAERVVVVFDWYDRLRPHQALGNATPAEIFGGAPRPGAAPPPCGRRGEATEPLGILIRFALPAERRLPYLERVA